MKQFVRQSLMAVAVLVSGMGIMKAADGDTFTAKSTEGIEMTFKVISETDKTCQVGDGSKVCLTDPYNGEGTLTIPEKPNGYQVITVGERAFAQIYKYSKIVIPSSVTVLEYRAFSMSSGYGDYLEEIILPSGLKRIGEACFEGREKWQLSALPSGVTSVGDYAFSGCKKITVSSLPQGMTIVPKAMFRYCESITEFTLHEGVTIIGNEAFSYCCLKSVKLPSTLREIGSSAFGRSGLTSVVLPEGLTTIGGAFYDCKELTSISIPSTVVSIDAGAFSGLPKLVSITLPEGLTSIPRSLFKGSGLESITLPKSVTTIEEGAFGECKQLKTVNWNSKVERIGQDAFLQCEQLLLSTIPASVKAVGNNAFAYCHAIQTMTLPASVEETGEGIFANCEGLRSATLADGIKKVVDRLFDGCESLQTVSLPASIEVIGKDAFSGCEAFEEIVLPQNLTTIDNYAFERSGLKRITWNKAITIIGYNAFSQCQFTEITIPGTITELPSYLFYRCENLTTVTLAEGFTEVPGSFFSGCQKLTTVNLPSTITTINGDAFRDTESLTQLVIPEGCTEIGGWAFFNSGVKKVWIPSTMQKTENAFKNSGLEEAVLAEGLTSIAGFFQNATKMKRVHLPASVVNIEGAFDGCGFIEEMSVDPNNTVFDSRNNCNGIIETATNTLVRGCSKTTIPTTVIAIGNKAFNGVRGIKDFVVPQQIKSIGWGAFMSSSLTSITLPEGLESLGIRAFEGTNIEEFTLPKSITEVPDKLFYECRYLNKVTLHDKTIGIRNMAFNSTESLTTVELPASLNWIAAGAFGNSNLEYLTIPATVTYIGANCFTTCRNVKHIVIEGNPQLHIGEEAFYQTWIDHLSFLTNSLTLNGCGKKAFYPDMLTYQAYYDEAIRESFTHYSRTVFDPFIGIMSEDEWMPILCSQKNFQLPEGIEAYIVTGVAGGKTQMQQVQSINKGQAVLLRLKDRTKASEIIKMASGDLLRYETKELDDSEVMSYEGGEEYRVAVGFTNIYAGNQDKVMFVFENGVFVRKLETEVNGLTGYIVLDPDEAGDMATIGLSVESTPGVKGDADGNGTVEPADVTVIQNLILKGKYSSQADVNKDHKVNAADIVEVVKIIKN